MGESAARPEPPRPIGPGGLVPPLVRRIAIALLVVAVGVGAPAGGGRADTGLPSQDAADTDPGAIAYATMEQFSATVGPRPSDTWAAIDAREFVLHALQQYGYEPSYQEFIASKGDDRLQSANIVALKPGESSATLVVGAHYDTVPGMAARLAEVQTPDTIVFVAFGAEETGLHGSLHYVKTMDDTARDGLVGMINLDGVAGGETLYSYGVEGEDSWLQKDILAAAEGLGVTLDTDIILQVTPPVSRGVGYEIAGDHVPFAGYEVPVAGFITGDDHLTPARASFWPMNTKADTVATMEKEHPGFAQRQLRDVVRVLDVILTSELATTP
jgi:alkaline phosphatase isozyme conversion protein